ncbi:GNAT family N-acetyltransferase [Demequina sp. NBRC 110052]|uniref:GNAT family N-acetyltransferase n=1 Tax=Demequina sp. NBRC 110052 TaxID=1570341 RepID=UPI0009FBF206|nr:GNAT family N-acetyltransferase [Demequina sp. NBRC 110052]
MQNIRMRLMRDADLPSVTALNAGASPAVNLLTEDEVRELFGLSDIALVATNRASEVIAFLVSLAPGQAYDSENYRWFEDRGVRHQYIDRIVVAPSAKGTGVGTALYESVFERARQRGASEITCEVNVEPPNPGSLTFHERLGFRQLAEQWTKDQTVRVALLSRPVY